MKIPQSGRLVSDVFTRLTKHYAFYIVLRFYRVTGQYHIYLIVVWRTHRVAVQYRMESYYHSYLINLRYIHQFDKHHQLYIVWRPHSMGYHHIYRSILKQLNYFDKTPLILLCYNKSLHAEITLKKNLTSRKKCSRSSSSVLCCTLVFNDLEYLTLFEDELIKINIINKILIVLVHTELLSTYHQISFYTQGPGWLNELGLWIQQLIQAYHQYGVGSSPAL